MKKKVKDLDKLNRIATDLVVEKALKDKLKEGQNKLKQNYMEQNRQNFNDENDISEDSMDSDEEEIMRKMKEKMTQAQGGSKKTQALKGGYKLVNEKEFFELVKNKKERIVCHFYHPDFMKCKILDKHLALVAYEHPETLFIKIVATEADFLIKKLQIRILPSVYFFQNGVVKDKLVGFEEFGVKDDFSTKLLTRRLGKFGAIKLKKHEKKMQVNYKDKKHVRGESSDEEY